MKYFFHIGDHDKLIIDDTGVELPDLKAAEREAIAAAESYQRDAALGSANIDH